MHNKKASRDCSCSRRSLTPFMLWANLCPHHCVCQLGVWNPSIIIIYSQSTDDWWSNDEHRQTNIDSQTSYEPVRTSNCICRFVQLAFRQGHAKIAKNTLLLFEKRDERQKSMWSSGRMIRLSFVIDLGDEMQHFGKRAYRVKLSQCLEQTTRNRFSTLVTTARTKSDAVPDQTNTQSTPAMTSQWQNCFATLLW